VLRVKEQNMEAGGACKNPWRLALDAPRGSPVHLDAVLPQRAGTRPPTRSCLPHAQLGEVSPTTLHAAVLQHIFGGAAEAPLCPGADGPRPSLVSLRDTQALHMRPGEPLAAGASMIGPEFAHIHGPQGGLGSWHLALSEADASAVLAAGWGELHLLAGQTLGDTPLPRGLVMVYAPRDEAEVRVVYRIVQASYAFARGEEPQRVL
jgi:hypothetical protein